MVGRRTTIEAYGSPGRSLRGKTALYVLLCGNGGLYVGVARDPSARLEQHVAGRRAGGALYTSMHGVVALVSLFRFGTRREAASAERWLKRRTRVKRAIARPWVTLPLLALLVGGRVRLGMGTLPV